MRGQGLRVRCSGTRHADYAVEGQGAGEREVCARRVNAQLANGWESGVGLGGRVWLVDSNGRIWKKVRSSKWKGKKEGEAKRKGVTARWVGGLDGEGRGRGWEGERDARREG